MRIAVVVLDSKRNRYTLLLVSLTPLTVVGMLLLWLWSHVAWYPTNPWNTKWIKGSACGFVGGRHGSTRPNKLLCMCVCVCVMVLLGLHSRYGRSTHT